MREFIIIGAHLAYMCCAETETVIVAYEMVLLNVIRNFIFLNVLWLDIG